MGTGLWRVVLDTNILVRALINERSDSGRTLLACERRIVIPLLSLSLVSEYRKTLADPELSENYPQLTPERVTVALARLLYVGDVVSSGRFRFKFPRDPKDAMLVELAVAAKATHIITTDRDLLDLAQGKDDAARRFRRALPALKVQRPDTFIRGLDIV